MPLELVSQSSIGLYGGLATFSMDNLKELNNQQTNSLPFDIVKVDNFNPGFYMGASFNYSLSDNYLIGIQYQYTTTGSRIGQKDYSGFYYFDQIASGHFIGIKPETVIERNSFFSVSLYLETGAIFTKLKMKEKLEVYDIKQESSESFFAVSVPVSAGIKASIPIIDKLSGTVSCGYLYDTGSKLHLKGNKYAVVAVNEIPVKTGWTGFRINAGLTFKLK
ncbi:MAG: hypothetical protein HPY62_05625 [Bacteroidales bacterium]|nr:hypothetical protein [Bacteroidales bacterium]